MSSKSSTADPKALRKRTSKKNKKVQKMNPKKNCRNIACFIYVPAVFYLTYDKQ